MYLYGSIENVGTGTEMILEKCLEQGLCEPEFRQDFDFVTTFWRKENGYETDLKINDIDKIPNKDTEKDIEKVTEKVTENQRKILNAITQRPHLSSEELSSIVGISAVKIRENLSKLKAKGLIKRIGPAKGGYWEMVR